MSSLALGLRLRQLRLTSVPARAHFSQSALAAAASIEKKPLNKKITLPKDPYLLSEKVVKFARNGKLDDAIALVLEAPKTRQNEVVWNHLIQESAKLGKASQSWQLLNDASQTDQIDTSSLSQLWTWHSLFVLTFLCSVTSL